MDWNVITAFTAVIMMGMVASGYIPLLSFKMSPWARWVFFGIIVLMVTMAARQFYWDLVQAMLGEDWVEVRAKMGGQKFSTVFNVGSIISCYLLLKARLLLIPEHDRKGWRWWNAWMHPCRLCNFWKKKN